MPSTSYSPLPNFRMSEAPPSAHTGIDFTGSLYAKSNQGDMQKCYITLFSCCITRAVHLELIEDLSAMNFMNTITKFCATRGTPSLLLMDNAKTYKTLVRLVDKLHANKGVKEFLLGKCIRRKFIRGSLVH